MKMNIKNIFDELPLTISLLLGCLFLIGSIMFTYYNKKKPAFLFLFIFLVLFHIKFKSILGYNYTIFIIYTYYFLVFFSYHLFFTFSKFFCMRTIVIIKGYLNESNYLKLFLWFFFVFLYRLFIPNFIFVTVLISLLLLSISKSNFSLIFFLSILLFWRFSVTFFYNFNFFTKFLCKMRRYLSHRACRSFIEYGPENLVKFSNRKTSMIIYIVSSVFGGVGILLVEEAAMGQTAFDEMLDFKLQNPNSTLEQQYEVFAESYKNQIKSNSLGRLMEKCGIAKVAKFEELMVVDKLNVLKDSEN